MKYKLIFIILVLLLSACEKVINVNTKDEDEKLVIEGIVTLGELEHSIKITKTLKLDDTNSIPFVDNAYVTLWDDLGNSQTLNYDSAGIYKTSNFPCFEGHTYNLEVKWNGNTYKSTSVMPYKVVIDTLMIEELDFGPQIFYYPIPKRKDPLNIKNFYSFKLYTNKERVKGIYLQDDQFSDGENMVEPIFGGEYKKSDSMTVEMFCINENIYKYFYSLSENIGGTGGAVPANPNSNISGGCLGYFSAQTKDKKSILIP